MKDVLEIGHAYCLRYLHLVAYINILNIHVCNYDFMSQKLGKKINQKFVLLKTAFDKKFVQQFP
jgi:hypothetical protein